MYGFAEFRLAFSGCRACHKASDNNLYTVLAYVLYGVRPDRGRLLDKSECSGDRGASWGHWGTAMVGANGKEGWERSEGGTGRCFTERKTGSAGLIYNSTLTLATAATPPIRGGGHTNAP